MPGASMELAVRVIHIVGRQACGFTTSIAKVAGCAGAWCFLQGPRPYSSHAPVTTHMLMARWRPRTQGCDMWQVQSSSWQWLQACTFAQRLDVWNGLSCYRLPAPSAGPSSALKLHAPLYRHVLDICAGRSLFAVASPSTSRRAKTAHRG